MKNYGELKAAIADWLMREDFESVIPTFVRLAEARLDRELRVRHMLVRAVAVLEQSLFVNLPSDFLEAKNVQFNTDTAGVRQLSYVTMQEADNIRTKGHTVPQFYTIHGNYLEIVPKVRAAKEIELTYYARIPALTNDAGTNWLLSLWPDLYLYAALLQSAPYLRDDERLATWSGLYAQLMEETRLQDARAETSGSTPRIRFNPIG